MAALRDPAGLLAAVLLLLTACWGYGVLWIGPRRAAAAGSVLPVPALRLVLGLGTLVVGLLALGIAGVLHVRGTGLLVAAGCVAAAWPLAARPARHAPFSIAGRAIPERPTAVFGTKLQAWHALPAPWTAGGNRSERVALAACLLVAAPTVLAAFTLPLAWDELMYHLPHATQWARAHSLVVNEGLRYPWFPYNVNLLYTLALLHGSDGWTHAVNVLMGWLTAALLYGFARRHCDRVVAATATAIWFVVARNEFDRAYVDLGTALFVFAAWLLIEARTASGQRWLVVAAGFCLGIALGSKYQALLLAPPVLAMAWWVERRPRVWAAAAAAAVLAGGYWYARNALHTGNPFNPVGAALFGFHDWDARDLHNQFADLRQQAGWPPVVFLAALLAWPLAAPAQRPLVRRAGLFTLLALAGWALTSRYPRYLLPAYPLLALLAAMALVAGVRRAGGRLPPGLAGRLAIAAAACMLAGAALYGAVEVHGHAKRIARAPHTDSVLERYLPGLRIREAMARLPVAQTYQLGFDDRIHYLPGTVRGDAFGPWRYVDYADLPAPRLAARLCAEAFSHFLVHAERFAHTHRAISDSAQFEPAASAGPAHFYRLRCTAPAL